jgi:Flp pilus assembly protein TadG
MIRARDEKGFVTVWTVAVFGAFISVVGVVVDAGSVVRERSDAYGAAAAAARAGAQELDEAAAVGGVIRLDPDAATATANAYLGTAGFVGTVDVEGTEVVVTISGETALQVFPGSIPYEVVATVELQTRGNS